MGENIGKSHLRLNSKKNKQLKIGKNLNRHFTKQDTEMESKHTKSCSTSLATRDMQIKTTTKYQYTSIKIAKTNKQKTQNN